MLILCYFAGRSIYFKPRIYIIFMYTNKYLCKIKNKYINTEDYILKLLIHKMKSRFETF